MGIPRSPGGGGWTDGSGRHGHVEVALSEGTREADRLVKVDGARQRMSGQHTRGTGGAGCGLPRRKEGFLKGSDRWHLPISVV